VRASLAGDVRVVVSRGTARPHFAAPRRRLLFGPDGPEYRAAQPGSRRRRSTGGSLAPAPRAWAGLPSAAEPRVQPGLRVIRSGPVPAAICAAGASVAPGPGRSRRASRNVSRISPAVLLTTPAALNCGRSLIAAKASLSPFRLLAHSKLASPLTLFFAWPNLGGLQGGSRGASGGQKELDKAETRS